MSRQLSQPAHISRQMADFMRDLAAPGVVNSTALGLRLLGLLGLLPGPSVPPGPPSANLVERARWHIWGHSHRQLGVAEVAAQLGVSRRSLERAFAAAGLGVLEEITRCRLNRAERLLRETHLPVQHIASLAGFGTPEQMRLRFHARHGCSPASFRKAGRQV